MDATDFSAAHISFLLIKLIYLSITIYPQKNSELLFFEGQNDDDDDDDSNVMAEEMNRVQVFGFIKVCMNVCVCQNG